MKEKILEYLLNHQGEFTSGEVLRREFGVSRTAIWKHMKTLKEEGYQITSVPNKGYQLTIEEDRLLAYELEKSLGKKVEVHQSIDSTNNHLKRNARDYPDEMIVLSEEQKKGRGRLGRSWDSPKGAGLFFSMLLRPRITMEESFKITGIAAAAVAEAIEEVTGLPARIKWPNDILVQGKKVSGILTEVSGEPDGINYIIVGIGINVNTPNFTGELKDRATSLYLEKGEKVSRKELFVRAANKFFRFYHGFTREKTLGEVHGILENRSAVLGKEVIILRGEEKKQGKAVEITKEGFLKVRYESGEEEVLSSGEVSVRGLGGYS
ncbi:biotin--[acetyl-CoA-carboxylase] ligase [Isachenkonia alkalipeptolytica]|uniref:Bifunctional ligase/repressor BirA n=1 Tax=Isachenkonia alkalipeptolytica TaxID=2565777 RepID=A0AA44BF50_9CLOT|nr:biotin--[acetyl-CoA-carboxylase] ligase [Isachenkonia alkalipeptolytica]NBG89682.1 biotin--[acetyl-CoA-carboxylase] ligase [Isachenkonia alkalipeptolytica]